MKHETTITANTAKLVFLAQNPNGWGRGETIKSAVKFLKQHTHKKPTEISVYLVKDGFTKEEALKDIEVGQMSVTYSSDKVILLNSAEI